VSRIACWVAVLAIVAVAIHVWKKGAQERAARKERARPYCM
jgi:hypothetical protein